MTQAQHLDPNTGEDVHRALKTDILGSGVVGVFDAPHKANQAFEVLMRLGYQPDEVGILITESTKRRFLLPSLLTHPPPLDDESVEAQADRPMSTEAEPPAEDATERIAMLQGAGAVSAMGALGGVLVAATAAVVAPGLGLLVLGPLAGLGAGFGALVGTVYGVPALENDHEHSMARYEAQVRAGKVLIQVTPRNAEDDLHIRNAWDFIQPAS